MVIIRAYNAVCFTELRFCAVIIFDEPYTIAMASQMVQFDHGTSATYLALFGSNKCFELKLYVKLS